MMVNDGIFPEKGKRITKIEIKTYLMKKSCSSKMIFISLYMLG